MFPEALYRGGALDSGPELLAMDQGFEGRAWRDGILVASRWWAEVPDLREWNLFLRGAGMAAVPTIPDPRELPFSAISWASQRVASSVDLTRHRALLTPLMLGVASLVLFIPLGASLRLLGERARLERAITAQERLVHEILVAREGAERDAATIQELMQLRPPAGQIRVLSALVRALPPGWQVLEWRVQDPSVVEATIRMPGADPRAMVRSLEASPWLDAVSVDLGGKPDEVVIKATVVAGGGRP